jgi:eukaryotic-like serine/threonine-protein kinase
MDAEVAGRSPRVVGRYVVYHELATGGMASVHIGRLMGPVGFSRTVAIKILHPQYAKDPEFVAMFVDEARLAARIRHPNVVATLDVVAKGKDLLLVMDYVPGETLGRLVRLAHAQGKRVPPAIVSAIVVDLLDGLHAAHEARDERDEPLSIVHRDVSPQNVMVGHDGTARVLDFGIANATFRVQTTRDGDLKGKFAYMSPEQVSRGKVDRRTDVFAAGIVLWEALTGLRLFAADSPAAIVARIIQDPIRPPGALIDGLPAAVDRVVLKALSRDRNDRYATANEFARALENALSPARRSDVRAWVGETANNVLEERARRVAEIESTTTSALPFPSAEAMLSDVGGPTDVPIVYGNADETVVAEPYGMEGSRSKRTIRIWFAGGVALVAGLTSVGLALRHPDGSAGSPAPHAPASAPTVSRQQAAAPQASEVQVPEPSATAVPTVASSSISSNNTPGTNLSPPAPLPIRSVSHATGPRPKNPCDPPFTFDDAGAKRWKPACL